MPNSETQLDNSKNYEDVNIIDIFFHFQVLLQTIELLWISKLEYMLMLIQ